MYDKIYKFLKKQKALMMEIDESEGLRDRERSGFDFQAERNVPGHNQLFESYDGKQVGLREILYDNTINYILGEGLRTSLADEFLLLNQPGVLNETTLSTAFASYTTSLLPAVRRIYSKLVAKDLVSVQPLGGPSGYIYWLDHTFANSLGGATAGQRLDRYRYNSYAASSEQGGIRAINFQLTSKLITAVTKKLKATFTTEAEQDLRSQWKLALEPELMDQVVEEIIREWDGLIIAALLAGVGAGNVNWNTTGYLAGDTSTTDQRSYRETLYEAIIDADTLVYNLKYQHCNWLMMGGTTFARLRKLEKFNADPQAIDQGANIQRRYEGTLANQYKVYVDPWFSANTILMGLRGDNWKYAIGYFSPYIPLFTSERYIINDDFTQHARGAMSRAAYGVLPETSGGTTNNGLATISIVTS